MTGCRWRGWRGSMGWWIRGGWGEGPGQNSRLKPLLQKLPPLRRQGRVGEVGGVGEEDGAKGLGRGAKTMNTNKSRLFQKLGIDDGMSLARLARQYGWVDPGRVG